MVLFCCGVLLCGRWWCGPDTEFDGVCADIVFFCGGGPHFGFCFCYVLKTFVGGCCFYRKLFIVIGFYIGL